MQNFYLEAIGCNSQRLCDSVELLESVQSTTTKNNNPKTKERKEASLMIYKKMGIYRMKNRR